MNNNWLLIEHTDAIKLTCNDFFVIIINIRENNIHTRLVSGMHPNYVGIRLDSTGKPIIKDI